jgi:hypothetical protein
MRIRGFCIHCGKEFQRSRNPKQGYCSKRSCQTQRKREWRRDRMQTDGDYRANQQASNKRWQSKNRGYWKRYREKNSDYVKANRCAQQARDAKKRADASTLAKSDAFPTTPLTLPGLYRLLPVEQECLAKSDALFVKILIEPGQSLTHTHSCKESTL